MQPNDEILEQFGVQLIAPLGGRLNQHWLVEAQRESLVLRRWSQPADEVDYELRLLKRIAALGWPVASAVGTIEQAGAIWSLFSFLPGDPASIENPVAEQRARGRLLAAFHADLAQLQGLEQRGRWRRCEEILGDSNLDCILADHEQERPEEIRLLRWHLEGYTEISALDPEEWELLTPMWWAWLIEGACQDLAAGIRDDGWTTKQLLRRSPLMGPDAVEYR